MTEFTDYDRIADTLFYLSDSITLDFVVQLSAKDKFGNRSFFHIESEYDSNKYNDVSSGRSIKRKMIFYFSLTNKQYFDGSFLLRPQDVQMLIMMIEQQVLPWYFDLKKRIFSIVDNKLVITGNYSNADYVRSEYQYLRFVPIIYTYEDNTYKEGIRIYINTDSNYADIDIDKFMGIYNILKNTDMYSAACNLATYVKSQPYNVNIWRKVGLASAYNGAEDNSTWNQDITKRSSNTSNEFIKNIKKKGDD